MKKIRWLSIPLILMTLGLEIRVNAAEVQSYNSQGIVGFGPGSGIQPLLILTNLIQLYLYFHKIQMVQSLIQGEIDH